ncbi:stAR-related lipid transfer protein 4 [Ailuropoda melanoleuca]|nr:stAR-related lipid transfer protein 4 [Ailuropoda melanoleuca]
MEGLPDAAAFATRLKNTLIQYHSIEDDEWRIAKKTKDVTIWRKPSEEFNGYLFLVGLSVDWSEKRPEFIRGYNHPCGWFCVPVKDSPYQSLLTGYIQTDLRGMIPQSAVDTAMASTLINFYGDLQKALQKA